MRALLLVLLVASGSIGAVGCNTIVLCDGDSPYVAAELPPLKLKPPELPDFALLRAEADKVVTTKPAKAKEWDGIGKRLLYPLKDIPAPGGHSFDEHWIAWDGIEGHRVLYVAYQRLAEASAISGEAGNRTDVYDVETGERLASWGRFGINFLLLVDFETRTRPAAIDGTPAMKKLMAREIGPEAVRYELAQQTGLALGIAGWGRSNHKRYIQVLWIPIPVGDE